jgi:CheY-like chemotaxis protein
MQLTAAWLLTLIALVGGLLVASTNAPPDARWLGPVFGLAAIALIPVFAAAVFRLQTKYRPQLMADQYFVQAELRVRQIAESRGLALSNAEPERLARRAARNFNVLRGASILWVDDNPTHIELEQQLLRELGVQQIDTVTSTREATERLAERPYHVVISDMHRGDNARAGLDVVPEGRRHGVPVIIYLADYDRDRGIPSGAFGITNRPDELIDLVLDALERLLG